MSSLNGSDDYYSSNYSSTDGTKNLPGTSNVLNVTVTGYVLHAWLYKTLFVCV